MNTKHQKPPAPRLALLVVTVGALAACGGGNSDTDAGTGGDAGGGADVGTGGGVDAEIDAAVGGGADGGAGGRVDAGADVAVGGGVDVVVGVGVDVAVGGGVEVAVGGGVDVGVDVGQDGGTQGPMLAGVTVTPGAAGSFSGTVEVPVGYTVDGTLAIACKRLGSECDTNGLVSVAVAGAGRTGTFDISGLAAGEWAVLPWKDVNNSQDFEAGDLYAAWTDSNGDLLWLQPGYQGSLVKMDVAPDDTPPTTNQDAGTPVVTPGLPTELVGTWVDVSSTAATGYTFNADGSYTYSAYFAMTLLRGCDRPTGYIEPYVYIYAQGNASVSGNLLTVEDRSGIYQRDVDCEYSRTGASLRLMSGSYVLGALPDGRRTLDVTWNGASTPNNYIEDLALPQNPAP
jgi:hypothetical protein